MFKYSKLIILFLAIFSLGAFVLVQAQDKPPVCGDGKVEGEEECDDANHDITDNCDTFAEAPYNAGQCKFTFCGDGAIQEPNGRGINEKCDAGTRGYCSDNPQTQCLSDSDCASRCIFPCTPQCGAKLLGWGWAANFGWLSLNRDNCDHLHSSVLNPDQFPYDPTQICLDYPDIDYYVQVDPDNNLTGRAWSESVGWVCVGNYCNNGQFGPSDPPGSQTQSWANVQEDGSQTPPIKGWARTKISGDDGWISLSCDNDGNGCKYPYGLNLAVDFYPPNGSENNKVLRQTLFGWAWNGSDLASGLGWILFTPQVSQPWLETKQGDIYAKEGITSPRPIGHFNATYRILAFGGIEALSAQGENFPWVDPSYGPIDFPTPLTRYSNILGKLDVEGLTCEFKGKQECINKYSKTVVNLNEVIRGWPAGPLGGKIYYYRGPLALNSIEFKNGEGFVNGAGTVIVDGDLTINGDITYQSNNGLNKFRNLASVAWIVRGDVKINPSVKNLVGAFIVLGNGSNCPAGGCGTFSSGDSANPFRVSGLIMARQFNFERGGGSEKEGSEVIIYDGRLLANTPPGVEDFAQALPIWREGVFSQ